MWEIPFLDFLETVRMRLPNPTEESVQSQMPRIDTILKSQPDLSAYLFSVLNRFEYNLWNGWMGRCTDEITVDTCKLHQILLLRTVADDVLKLVADEKFGSLDRQAKPPVSIIIPAWNQWAFTHLTLTSLFSNTVWPEFEVIVIDNGSADETREELPRMALSERRLKVIRNTVNLGFSGANNQGVESAAHEHLIFLNNDVRIKHADWIGQMMRSFLMHPRVGATGEFAVVDCFTGDRENYYQKVYFPGWSIPSAWISGYNVLTTKRALADAGGWRGDLYGPAGYEDIHLGYALRTAGWICLSPNEIPDIQHLIGKTRFTEAGKEYVAKHSPAEDKHRIFCRHFGSREFRPAA